MLIHRNNYRCPSKFQTCDSTVIQNANERRLLIREYEIEMLIRTPILFVLISCISNLYYTSRTLYFRQKTAQTRAHGGRKQTPVLPLPVTYLDASQLCHISKGDTFFCTDGFPSKNARYFKQAESSM